MSINRTAERDAIQAAMQRLLAGTPTRSTGALTVVQLAAEAEIDDLEAAHKQLRRHISELTE